MRLPLAGFADRTIARLAAATGARSIATLDGATLLCERAMLGRMVIPGRISAGGGCRMFDAVGDTVAINLARPADRELLPALFETDTLGPYGQEAIAERIAHCDAAALVKRGRSMGLAIASEREVLPPAAAAPCTLLTAGCATTASRGQSPRVVDLSSLWAGPLAAHLLWLAGADVVKVESRARPDSGRSGDDRFYALLNQGKASVVLNFSDATDRQVLLSIIAAADIVIESARPRALAQLGIDAAQIVRSTPGLTWLSITGHGAEGEAGEWVGFGDDCGVAGGLSAALRAASGAAGFVGDAIADPLAGMEAALVAWDAWTSRRGGRFVLAMSHVVARAVAESRTHDPAQWQATLRAWSAAVGEPFPAVRLRSIGALPALGEHTHSYRERFGLRPA
jgi:CoA-transferase family III